MIKFLMRLSRLSRGKRVLVVVDTSGSMDFCPADRVSFKKMQLTDSGSYFSPKTSGYDKVILITDGEIVGVPDDVEVWIATKR